MNETTNAATKDASANGSAGRNRLKPGEVRIVVSMTADQSAALNRALAMMWAKRGYVGDMPSAGDLIGEWLASLTQTAPSPDATITAIHAAAQVAPKLSKK